MPEFDEEESLLFARSTHLPDYFEETEVQKLLFTSVISLLSLGKRRLILEKVDGGLLCLLSYVMDLIKELLDFFLFLELGVINTPLLSHVVLGRRVTVNNLLADLLYVTSFGPVGEFLIKFFLSKFALFIDLS